MASEPKTGRNPVKPIFQEGQIACILGMEFPDGCVKVDMEFDGIVYGVCSQDNKPDPREWPRGELRPLTKREVGPMKSELESLIVDDATAEKLEGEARGKISNGDKVFVLQVRDTEARGKGSEEWQATGLRWFPTLKEANRELYATKKTSSRYQYRVWRYTASEEN